MSEVIVKGNLTQDVELRFTNAGKPFASLTVAVSERRFNKQSNDWEDTDPWFAKCTLWGAEAEHAAQSLMKGIRVIGHGKIKQRNWEDQQGNRRSSVEVDLFEIGPSLKFGTTQFTRAERNGGSVGASTGGFAQSGEGQGFSGAQNGGWAETTATLDGTEAPF